SRADPRAAPLGSHRTHPIRPLYRPVFVGIRLHDLFHDAVPFQLLEHLDGTGGSARREPLSDRLVRREPVDADADYSRHPNRQVSAAAEPVVLASAGDEPGHYGDRNRHPVLALGPLPGTLQAADALLAPPGSHVAVLRAADTERQDAAA